MESEGLRLHVLLRDWVGLTFAETGDLAFVESRVVAREFEDLAGSLTLDETTGNPEGAPSSCRPDLSEVRNVFVNNDLERLLATPIVQRDEHEFLPMAACALAPASDGSELPDEGFRLLKDC